MQHLYKRVIPILLLRNGGLYKTQKFKNPVYIGDPMNAVKIFNEKEVDELVFLDIEASILKKEPDYELLQNIANECFYAIVLWRRYTYSRADKQDHKDRGRKDSY